MAPALYPLCIRFVTALYPLFIIRYGLDPWCAVAPGTLARPGRARKEAVTCGKAELVYHRSLTVAARLASPTIARAAEALPGRRILVTGASLTFQLT